MITILTVDRFDCNALTNGLSRVSASWGRGVRAVARVDEVGMGALAGPVVAAAVILA
jgi:hypothetical protein